MAKLVLTALLQLVFLIGLGIGGGTVWWAEHQPVAIGFTWPAPIRWALPADLKRFAFTGLEAQRDAALAGEKAAQAQLSALTTQSSARIAEANQIAQSAKLSARKAQAKERAVLVVKRGSDPACQFAAKVDQAFVGELAK